MSKAKICLSLALSFIVSFSAVADEYTCEAPSKLHEQKMNKYQLPSFPSLLKDCGLGDLLSSFGFDLNVSLPDAGLFCGYSTNDIASWYGVNTSASASGSVGVNLNAVSDGKAIFGDVSLFEGGE